MTATILYSVEPTAAGLGDFRDRLLQRIRHKGEVACRTLTSQPWALFVAGIDEAHCGGHLLWHLHDSTHPRHAPELAAVLGDPIKDLYVEIDRTFGRLLDLVDPNTNVLFVSTHGMGPAFDGNTILDEVLRRIEGLDPGVPVDLETQLRRVVRWRQVYDRMPRPLQRLLEPFRRRYGRTAFKDRRTAEAKGRRSFWLPTHDLHGGIRINLVGRETALVANSVSEAAAALREIEAPDLRRRLSETAYACVREFFPGAAPRRFWKGFLASA